MAGEEGKEETGSPVERQLSGQIKYSNNPHLLCKGRLGAEGQRGGGLGGHGEVVGGGQGHQVGQREARIAAFGPAQLKPGRESVKSEKITAVVGQLAACGTARTNGKPISSQPRISDIFGGKRTPRTLD